VGAVVSTVARFGPTTPTRVRDTGWDLPSCPQQGDTLTKLFPQINYCQYTVHPLTAIMMTRSVGAAGFELMTLLWSRPIKWRAPHRSLLTDLIAKAAKLSPIGWSVEAKRVVAGCPGRMAAVRELDSVFVSRRACAGVCGRDAQTSGFSARVAPVELGQWIVNKRVDSIARPCAPA
jgi:hypothetical protein